MISPNIAKLALTPPVVGCVKTMIDNNPASLCFFIAAEVFAICTKDKIPSCILAPPLVQHKIKGSFFLVASSIALVIFSPTAADMLPMKKLESITPITHGRPLIFPVPVITASFMPVCF